MWKTLHRNFWLPRPKTAGYLPQRQAIEAVSCCFDYCELVLTLMETTTCRLSQELVFMLIKTDFCCLSYELVFNVDGDDGAMLSEL